MTETSWTQEEIALFNILVKYWLDISPGDYFGACQSAMEYFSSARKARMAEMVSARLPMRPVSHERHHVQEVPIINLELVAKLAKPCSTLGLSVKAERGLLSSVRAKDTAPKEIRKMAPFPVIAYVLDLVTTREDILFARMQMGKTSLKEIKKALNQMGLSLGMDIDPVTSSAVLAKIAKHM